MAPPPPYIYRHISYNFICWCALPTTASRRERLLSASGTLRFITPGDITTIAFLHYITAPSQRAYHAASATWGDYCRHIMVRAHFMHLPLADFETWAWEFTAFIIHCFVYFSWYACYKIPPRLARAKPPASSSAAKIRFESAIASYWGDEIIEIDFGLSRLIEGLHYWFRRHDIYTLFEFRNTDIICTALPSQRYRNRRL